MARRGKSDLHDSALEVDMGEDKTPIHIKSAGEDLLKAIDDRSPHGIAKALHSAIGGMEDSDEKA